ncbi:MAG: adenosine deaminase, partial [Propionibacterium sp.]
MTLTIEQLRKLPKVSLHDHLDGGLRPQTVIDHCNETGHSVPTKDADALGKWFFNAADSGNLVTYLSTFNYTIGAMQTYEHLQRVAYEFVLDQAADGVIYAEARWAPEQHTQAGLSESQAVEAVRDGIEKGVAEITAAGGDIAVNQILTSMRHLAPTTRIAELAVKYRDQGVCGFDIAGAEDGFRPARFKEAFDYLRANNAWITIHAGEADGIPSIWEAVQVCGAHRIGHGVRLIEDIDGDKLGRLSEYIRNQRIALEVCPTSNLQTGVAKTLAEHPVNRFRELGF